MSGIGRERRRRRRNEHGAGHRKDQPAPRWVLGVGGRILPAGTDGLDLEPRFAIGSITASKAKPKPLTNDKQADILLSGITTIDNPAARNLYLDVTSGSPTGSTSTVLPSTTRRARANTILAMTSSPAQSALGDLKHRK
jgi:hypothetical protein